MKTARGYTRLTLRSLFENSPFDPAGVVFSVQRVAGELWTFLPAVHLTVHAVEGQWLNLRACGYMKIGIFVTWWRCVRPALRQQENAIEPLRIGSHRIERSHGGIRRGAAAAEVGPVGLS